MLKDTQKAEEKQVKTRQVERQLVEILWPLLVRLKQKVDRRLVKTFLGVVWRS